MEPALTHPTLILQIREQFLTVQIIKLRVPHNNRVPRQVPLSVVMLMTLLRLPTQQPPLRHTQRQRQF